jgi:hypothetical protein
VNPSILAQNEYTLQDLIFRVFSNGVIEVEYSVEADPTKLRIELPIFGDQISGLIIRDQDGLPLDTSTSETGVIVDSIGSTIVNATYLTSSFTVKIGSVWSLNATVPIETLIILPSGVTIFDISHIPRDLYVTNGNQHLLMPPGKISVSYLLEISTIKEEARQAFNEVEEAINTIRDLGIVVKDAEDLLLQSSHRTREKRKPDDRFSNSRNKFC